MELQGRRQWNRRRLHSGQQPVVSFFLPLLEGELSKHLNSSKKEDTQESSSDVDDSEEWSRNSEDSKDSDSEYEDSHPQKKKIKAEVTETPSFRSSWTPRIGKACISYFVRRIPLKNLF